jgi:V8-like Glu-specific endopeptidase
MSALRLVAVAWTLAALAACGPMPDSNLEGQKNPEYQQQRTPIVGGTLDSNDPAVVGIAVRTNSGYYSFCTGTLIGTKTVVTAGHCWSPYGQLTPYYIVFGSSMSSPDQVVKVASSGWVRHPSYVSTNGQPQHDVSVIQLSQAVTNVAPIGLNLVQPTHGLEGQPIRHVGFGITSAGANEDGSKRQVTFPINQVTDELIESGATGEQTCNGDSGGPGFITMDGTEVVAGLVSFGDKTCTQGGYDVNVATYSSWILTTMRAWETPSCLADGMCQDGCTPVDPDCACVADGVCSPLCAIPELDPDCPRNCGADGVCSTGTCASPDPDCVAAGKVCTSASQCAGRECMNDPQHSATYCTMSCRLDSDCASSGMKCASGFCQLPQGQTANIGDMCDETTYCTDGVCTGPSAGDMRCRIACTGPGTCPGSNQVCTPGNPSSFCEEQVAQPAVVSPLANTPAVHPQSCSSSASGPWGLAVLAMAGLVLGGRRARR